jgi:hypothetical protein
MVPLVAVFFTFNREGVIPANPTKLEDFDFQISSSMLSVPLRLFIFLYRISKGLLPDLVQDVLLQKLCTI